MVRARCQQDEIPQHPVVRSLGQALWTGAPVTKKKEVPMNDATEVAVVGAPLSRPISGFLQQLRIRSNQSSKLSKIVIRDG